MNSTPRTCHSVVWDPVAFAFPCSRSEDVSGEQCLQRIVTEPGIGLTLGGTVVGDPVKVKRQRARDVATIYHNLPDSRKSSKSPSRMALTCSIQQKRMQLVNPRRKCKPRSCISNRDSSSTPSIGDESSESSGFVVLTSSSRPNFSLAYERDQTTGDCPENSGLINIYFSSRGRN